MANYRELLMNIIFFGEAYVKATKLKEDEKAKRYHTALLENKQKLQYEMLQEEQKRAKKKDRLLEKERDRETKALDYITGPGTGAPPKVDLLEEKPVGKSFLEKTKLGLEAKPTISSKMGLPSSATALDRIRGGEGRLPHQRRRIDALPTGPELVQQQAGRGMEQRLPGGSYQRAAGTQGLDRGAISMPGIDVVSTPLADQPKASGRRSPYQRDIPSLQQLDEMGFPVLSATQTAEKESNLIGMGFEEPGVESFIPKKLIPETTQLLQKDVETEKATADIIKAHKPQTPDWEIRRQDADAKQLVADTVFPLRKIVVPYSSKWLKENTESRVLKLPTGQEYYTVYDKYSGDPYSKTELIKPEGNYPMSMEQSMTILAEFPELAVSINPDTTPIQALRLISATMSDPDAPKNTRDFEFTGFVPGPKGTKTMIWTHKNDLSNIYEVSTNAGVEEPYTILEIQNLATMNNVELPSNLTPSEATKRGLRVIKTPTPGELYEEQLNRPLGFTALAQIAELKLKDKDGNTVPVSAGMSMQDLIDDGVDIESVNALKMSRGASWTDEDGNVYQQWINSTGTVRTVEQVMKPDGKPLKQKLTVKEKETAKLTFADIDRFQKGIQTSLRTFATTKRYYNIVNEAFEEIAMILEGRDPRTGQAFTSEAGFVSKEDLEQTFEKAMRGPVPGFRDAGAPISFSEPNERGNIVLKYNPQSINAATQALIFAFNKVLDPDSTVRVAEYERVNIGQSVAEQLRGGLRRMTKGGTGLWLDEIQGIKNISDKMFARNQDYYRRATSDRVFQILDVADPTSVNYIKGIKMGTYFNSVLGELWSWPGTGETQEGRMTLTPVSNATEWRNAAFKWAIGETDLPGTTQQGTTVESTLDGAPRG
jgi:hypothetical protein